MEEAYDVAVEALATVHALYTCRPESNPQLAHLIALLEQLAQMLAP